MSEENKNITLEEVKAFIEDNHNNVDVSEFKTNLINTFLESKEGQKYLQPKFDAKVTKAIDTWKTKTLPTVLEEEIRKRNPEETPEQKRIRELEEKLTQQERNAEYSKLKNNGIQLLEQNNLSTGLIDYLKFNTEEELRLAIDGISDIWGKSVTDAVTTKLKTDGKTPKSSTSKKVEQMTKEKLLSMSVQESSAFYKENPEEFNRLMKR